MSRRKRSSPADDLFELAAKLPWWLCFILAAISYAVLRHYAVAELVVAPAPGQMGNMVTEVMMKGLASAGQYILPIVLVFGGIASFLGRRRRQALAQSVADNTSGGVLRSMIWQDFELLVGEAFRMLGYSVAETGGGGRRWRCRPRIAQGRGGVLGPVQAMAGLQGFRDRRPRALRRDGRTWGGRWVRGHVRSIHIGRQGLC